ncbi:MAG: UDP-4-amino-4-deoxy-L-arabinose--oxoglutarate aminotransferase [Acidimicrobiales bacterium]|nr:UDP-4-amino-4-deoxy-L-arabinose--oxoglutarate aminotransferase [Acidimicrobiales bacterium]
MGFMRAGFLQFSPPSIGEDEINEVIDTLRSDWITTGPKTKRFESEFAERVHAPDALALFSCTDALQVALAALGIGPGDAVFTTTFTFCASAHVVEHLGATPILVDVEADTLNLSAEALRKAVAEVVAEGRLAPKAIIPVHYSGNPCDMAAIDAIALEYGLAIVEDAAHALPAEIGGRTIGEPTGPDGLVRATAFSFYATKNMTTGEGGMLTGPPDFMEEARLWALHGMSRDAWKRYGQGGSWFYEVVRPGFKCNMTDIQASLGLHQIRRLDEFQLRRAEVVARYNAAFADLDEVQTPIEGPGRSAWHLYPIRLRLDRLTIGRSEFIDELAARNIGASVHFIPLHIHPFYRDKYSLTREQLPVASAEYERLVSLPLHPRLSDSDIEDVTQAVIDIVDHNRQ